MREIKNVGKAVTFNLKMNELELVEKIIATGKYKRADIPRRGIKSLCEELEINVDN